MAELSSEKVLADITGEQISLSDARLPPADQPSGLFNQVYKRCSEWLKDPNNSLTLRYVDQSSWPSVIKSALTASSSRLAGTEYYRISERIDLEESCSILDSLQTSQTNTKQEFERINNAITVEADFQQIKIFSSSSSMIAISEDCVSIFENGQHLRTVSDLDKENTTMLLARIADKASDGYGGVLTAIAEFDTWYQHRFGERAIFRNFVDPQDQQNEIDKALLSIQYQNYSLPEVSTFKSNLKSQPMTDIQEFQADPIREYRKLGFMRVKVADIIAAKPEGDGWDFEDRGPNYLYNMAQAMINGEYLPTFPKRLANKSGDNGVVLEKRGNLYGITTNGRHRVAALKGIDPELTVWAEVTEAII